LSTLVKAQELQSRQIVNQILMDVRRLTTSWTKTLTQLGFERRKRRARSRMWQFDGQRRPQLEGLKPRVLLAADYTVTTLDDVAINLTDSLWSLREALQAAATDVENDVDTIEFAPFGRPVPFLGRKHPV